MSHVDMVNSACKVTTFFYINCHFVIKKYLRPFLCRLQENNYLCNHKIA